MNQFKPQFSLFLLPLFFSLFSLMQPAETDPPVKHEHSPFCGADHLRALQLEKDPGLEMKENQKELAYQAYIKEKQQQGAQRASAPIILPVVVHITHQNGPENISDAQVLQALQDLNDAFANVGYYDQGTGVNTEIQFCLAQQDPAGYYSTGITRHESPLTVVDMLTQDVPMKDISRWEPTEYINIYVVKDICTGGQCNVLGYAFFPTSHGQPEDGIVIEAEYFGSSQGNSAIMAHEMGHYLDLYHTFQGGCTNNNCLSDGDRVCDTPPDGSTAAIPCNDSMNSCTTDALSGFTSDQNDMFWNYMDYGDQNCFSAFTQGQTDRMHFAINNIRQSLLSSDACIDPCTNLVTADFLPNDTLIQLGSTLSFSNTGVGSTEFEWTIDGMVVSNSPNFNYTFNSGGLHEVTLTVSNGDTFCVKSYSSDVFVIGCAGDAHVSDANGTDASSCGSPGNPCKTIQYALDSIVCSGDTVFIHSGTYSLSGAANPLTPVAKIPENYSVTFFGVEDNGPVIIDGLGQRRGFQYYYTTSGCPDNNGDDGFDIATTFNFTHLTVQNCFYAAQSCGTAFNAFGGGVQLLNSEGSQLYVSMIDCEFINNSLTDYSTLNNNGRSTSGGAVYINGRVANNVSPANDATVFIDSCSFTGNFCDQNDNGGHGGALYIGNVSSASVANSFFCDNYTYSTNADNGDMTLDRNAGGAVIIFDTYSGPSHQYSFDKCAFVSNSSTTLDGITLTEKSEGGALFLHGGFNPGTSSANVVVGNSIFYDNNIETGIEHVDNNGGTLDLVSVGNNIFGNAFALDVVPDDTIACSGFDLTVDPVIPLADYDWSNGDTGITTTIIDPGMYTVTITLGNCETEDSINVIFQEADAILDLTLEDCAADSSYLTVSICNPGGLPMPANTPVSLYAGNPTNSVASLLLTLPGLGSPILPGQCLDINLVLPTVLMQPIFVVVNDDGSLMPPFDLSTDFPLTAIQECNFLNNIDSFVVNGLSLPLDLGPDTAICPTSVVALEAGPGFLSYLWQDGFNMPDYTAPGPGLYWVEVYDGCTIQRDSVLITPDSSLHFDLGPDIFLCNEDTAVISLNNPIFTTIDWIPSDFLDCDTCQTVITEPDTSITYIVLASTAGGCFDADTVQVNKDVGALSSIDTTICEGETVVFGGNQIQTPGVYIDSFPLPNGCDSLAIMNLTVNNVDTSLLDTAVCTNEVFNYFGTLINAGDSLLIPYMASGTDCDSFLLIRVAALPLGMTDTTIQICEGDSIMIFGKFESDEGIYSQTVSGVNGCDSTHTISLTFFPPISLQLVASSTCEGQENGSLSVLATGGAPGYQYNWNVPGAADSVLANVGVGTYAVTVTDEGGCQAADSMMVNAFPEPNWFLEINDASCFGLSDGLISIVGDDGLLYSLDSIDFQSDTAFSDLPAGDYTLYVQDSNDCVFSQPLSIFAPPPVEVVLPPDTTILLGSSVQISAAFSTPFISSILWDPTATLSCTDCQNPVATPTETTRYTVEIADESGCIDTASIRISILVRCDEGALLLPNVFTPNGDGVNDFFEIINKFGPETIQSFKVFDRWGELILDEKGRDARWDGTFNGKIMPSDVYVYLIEFNCPNGERSMVAGDVTLIR